MSLLSQSLGVLVNMILLKTQQRDLACTLR